MPSPSARSGKNQVHALALGAVGDYDAAIGLYDAFLPHVDNWATCDQLPVRVLAQRPVETLVHVDRWLASGSCHTMRFAIGVLMRLFLGERFEPCSSASVLSRGFWTRSPRPGFPARPTVRSRGRMPTTWT